ncbi:MAG: restriction endonuclease subunit S [Clostridia bacterium]|jgi:type I restriction enzyme S subunit|nr:restriction endonuclease subunit S [Clostridia bacterium]
MRWGDLATLKYGKRLRGYENVEAHYRVYGTDGPIGWHHEPLCNHPTVIVGRKGAYRGIHYSPEPCFVIDTAFYLEPRVEFDMRWAYYELLNRDINSMDSGSAIPSTSREAFYQLPVAVPSIEEQRAIAHILGTLDDKIELNRRMNETLEAIARAIFKSWFLDFDPVIDNALKVGNTIPSELEEKAARRREVLARTRAEGHPAGLPEPLAKLFPDEFEERELGWIPKGWRVGTLREVVNLVKDGVNPLDTPDAEFLHFSIPAFDEGVMPKRERGEAIKSFKFRVPAGAVLLSKLNPEIKRVWLVDISDNDRAICSTEFLVLLAQPPFTKSFVYCLVQSSNFRRELEGLVTGTSKSHQRAQPEAVLSIATVLPERPLLAAFERIVAPMLETTLIKKRESYTLAALRDTLLPKLISGELRVSSRIIRDFEVLPKQV